MDAKHSVSIKNHSREFRFLFGKILHGHSWSEPRTVVAMLVTCPRSMDKISCYALGWSLEEACLTSMPIKFKT